MRGGQTAFVLIDAQPDRIAGLAVELAAVEGVAKASTVAGEWDLGTDEEALRAGALRPRRPPWDGSAR